MNLAALARQRDEQASADGNGQSNVFVLYQAEAACHAAREAE